MILGVKPVAPPVRVAPEAELLRRPKVALYVRNPWLTVAGSEAPSVVVYADGSVIRQLPSEKGSPTPKFVEGTVGDLPGLMDELGNRLLPLGEQLSISEWTDGDTVEIFIDTDHGWIRRAVYGMGAGCIAAPGSRVAAPASFVEACHMLRDATKLNEHDYIVRTVELILRNSEDRRYDSVPWPEAVPAPPTRAAEQKMILHRIPSQYLHQARAMVQSSRSVDVAGRKWDALAVRIVLPGDEYLATVYRETWRAYASRQAERK